MRLLVVTCASIAAFALLACGGAPPPPSEEPAAHGESKSDSTSPAEAASSAAPAASSESAVSAPAPAPPSTDSSAAPADDPWMASHQMPPKDVLHAVRPVQAKAQACFRAGVKRDPSTSGEVKIRFVVTNDGAVRVWKDDGSSMTDGDVTKCVGELIKSVKFPKQKSPGDAYGTYTVNFSP